MTLNTWCFFCSQRVLEPEMNLANNTAIVLTDYGTNCEPMHFSLNKGHIYGIEIVAPTRECANDVVDIICACHSVINNFNPESSEEVIKRFDKNESNWLSQIGKLGVVYHDDSLMYACKMAQKVYGNQVFENAVCKYYVAHEIYSLHPMELHPLEDPFVTEYLLSERIKIANVIVGCYAVLEELHMQIKASQDNPSVIGGEWNPLVRDELSQRLACKEIDIEKNIPWLTRNGVVRPFKPTVVKPRVLCEWSDGEEICDFEFNILDAILELSYMRSQLASHGLKDKVLKLSVYDAENAFLLARTLLLDYFGINLFEDYNSKE